MRRVVITGIGVVSCIGNNKEDVLDSLRAGRSGIVANESFKEMGLRSNVSGSVNIDIKRVISRRLSMAIADASMLVDGREIYTAENLRVGMFTSTDNF